MNDPVDFDHANSRRKKAQASEDIVRKNEGRERSTMNEPAKNLPRRFFFCWEYVHYVGHKHMGNKKDIGKIHISRFFFSSRQILVSRVIIVQNL